MKINSVAALEVLDSRGNPTVQVTVVLKNGTAGTASVPSGASTGSHEAVELRDDNPKRYGGKGVQRAVRNVAGPLAKAVRGLDVRDQKKIDAVMLRADGTENKKKLGANAILGVSLAAARASSVAQKLPLYRSLRKTFHLPTTNYKLPTPMMNVLNGGLHAEWAIDVQECMIVPRLPSFHERLRAGSEIFHALKELLARAGHATQVGDEGGFAPRLEKGEAALRMLGQAITHAGYTPGKDVALAIDAAASEWYEPRADRYRLRAEGQTLTADALLDRYESWLQRFPLISIEDPFAEDDWKNWAIANNRLGGRVRIVGDDLFTTNIKRLEQGIAVKAANSILIKLNQIGTLSETMAVIERARQEKMTVIISHRSGETPDTFIADLAVAVNAEYIKTGSLSRGERVAKYNRLLEIEGELHS